MSNYRIAAYSFSAGVLIGSAIFVVASISLAPGNAEPTSARALVPAGEIYPVAYDTSTPGMMMLPSKQPDITYNSPTDPFGLGGGQNDLTVRKLFIINQLFNGGRSQLGLKQPLAFSDLALLSKLFGSESGQPFSNTSKLDIGDLLILNQIFNGGKSMNNSVSVSPDFGRLLLLYYLFHN